MYLSSKSLKHFYDRRPDFTSENIGQVHAVLKDPDFIVRNVKEEDGMIVRKRAEFLFLKVDRYGQRFLACPVEVGVWEESTALWCVSFFSAKFSYLTQFPLLWSKEDGRSLHRDDSPERTNLQ